MNTEVHLRVISTETEGRYCLIELSVPPHFPGAPLHFHRHMAERFVVLEGSLDTDIAGETRTLRAGDSAVALPGDVHSFRNSSDDRTRFLLVATPGGHESFFAELMDWMEKEPVWPPRNQQALVEFGRRHDTEYVNSQR
ncbi:cupin domain-containing protein [Terriglobus albidus]|uniref:cupin domain-containing protein n=1 Tax=Terriglobus albidus TaxID=1592106 RepID=UPI0021E059BA|nr:cupin domain-containing protein [Terriglobus albidus]